MTKLPSMPFYVGDWRKDPAIQSLSYHDRGVWFEMMCLMWESPVRGKLILNGKAMPKESLARALGLDKQTFEKALSALLAAGVPSHCTTTDALMNRRMVRDEEIRAIRAENGKLGGNPVLLIRQANHPPTKPDNQIHEDETVTEVRLHGIPKNPEEVIRFGATCNPPVEPQTCRDFFSYYEGISRKNENGEVFWITTGENPSIITKWKLRLPSWIPRKAAAAGGQVPLWQQIKSIEALLHDLEKQLIAIPLVNGGLYPKEAEQAKAKRAPLIERRKQLRADLAALNARAAGG